MSDFPLLRVITWTKVRRLIHTSPLSPFVEKQISTGTKPFKEANIGFVINTYSGVKGSFTRLHRTFPSRTPGEQ